MKSGYTDITVLLDRSGSMESVRGDMEGGFNTFIQEQQAAPGDCIVSLYQFDTQHELVYSGLHVGLVPKLSLVPRGGTALLDALGFAMNETGRRLASMREEDRPENVLFIIITDGQENRSHEFSRTLIKEMVEHQTNVYKWTFTYLGANVDSFTEAGSIGIGASTTMDYMPTSGGIKGSFKSLSRGTKEVRTCGTLSYSSEERAAAVAK